MDWQSLRRQRLAKAASSHQETPPQGRFETLSLRLTEAWRRFMDASTVEKSVIGGGFLLVVISVPVAIAVLASGGGDSASGAAAATSTPADIYVVEGGPTIDFPDTPTLPATATATPRPTDEPTDEPDEEPANRADCDAIAGTAYQSDEERDWYIANCLGGDDDPVVTNPPGSGSPSPTQPPTSGPPPTSPPQPSPTASGPSDATIIGHAVGWLSTDDPSYEVLTSTCSVSQVTGSQWLVSCDTRPAGCTGAACSDIIRATVCVTAPTYTVWRC